MISLIIENKIIETGFYKTPTIHNYISEDKLVCQIRKANISNLEEFLLGKEYLEDDSLEIQSEDYMKTYSNRGEYDPLLGFKI